MKKKTTKRVAKKTPRKKAPVRKPAPPPKPEEKPTAEQPDGSQQPPNAVLLPQAALAQVVNELGRISLQVGKLVGILEDNGIAVNATQNNGEGDGK